MAPLRRRFRPQPDASGERPPRLRRQGRGFPGAAAAARWPRPPVPPVRCAGPATRSSAAGSTARPPSSTPGRWRSWKPQVGHGPGRAGGRGHPSEPRLNRGCAPRRGCQRRGAQRAAGQPRRLLPQGRCLQPLCGRLYQVSGGGAGDTPQGRRERSAAGPGAVGAGGARLSPGARWLTALSAPPQRPGAGPVRDQASPAAGSGVRGSGEVLAGLCGLQDGAAGGLLRAGGARWSQQVRNGARCPRLGADAPTVLTPAALAGPSWVPGTRVPSYALSACLCLSGCWSRSGNHCCGTGFALLSAWFRGNNELKFSTLSFKPLYVYRLL